MTHQNLVSNFAAKRSIEAFHTGSLADLSADGRWLFTMCGNQIKITDLNIGQQVQTLGLVEDESDITSFRLSPDQKFVVVAYRNLLLKQWSWSHTPTPLLLRSWKALHSAPVVCMNFFRVAAPCILATGGSDFSVKVWDLDRQFCTHNLRGAKSVITCIEYAQMGDTILLIAGTADGSICVWNLTAGRDPVTILQRHSSAVTVLLMFEETLLSAGRDQVIYLWSLVKSVNATAVFVYEKSIPCFEPIAAAALLPKTLVGDIVVLTAGESGVPKTWSTRTGAQLDSLQSVGGPAIQMLLCVDANFVCFVTETQNFYFVDVDNLHCIKKQMVGGNDEILDADFIGEQQLLVATNAPELRVYACSDFSCQVLPGHSEAVLSVDVANNLFAKAADNVVTCFASGSKDNTVRLWSASSGQDQHYGSIAVATGHTKSVTCVRFARQSPPAFLASVSEDHTLKLWDLVEFRGKKVAKHQSSAVAQLQSICTVVAHNKDITAVDVSPNDKLLATSSMDKTVKIWRVQERAMQCVAVISGHKRGVWDVRFSPFDQVVASCSGDCTVKIFALSDRSCLKTFEGHESAVLRVRFLPSGLQLLSTDTAGLMKLWTIKSSECVKTLDAHEGKVWALEISAHLPCLRALSGGGDSKLTLWEDITAKEQMEADVKEEVLVKQEQQLSNLVYKKAYAKALRLALTLQRPKYAYDIVRSLALGDQTSQTTLEEVVCILNNSQLETLLSYVVEWNTNGRTCFVAQTALAAILRVREPDDLRKLSGMRGHLEALLPYTERHFERLSNLKQQATFLDYVWKCVKPIMEDVGSDAQAPIA